MKWIESPKSLLDEFSREHDLGKLSEEKQFEHFAAYLTAGRHLSEAFDTSDIVTGSGGDTGIDGIAVIVNGSLIDDADLVKDYADRNGYLDVSFVFVQAERSSRIEVHQDQALHVRRSRLFKAWPPWPVVSPVSAQTFDTPVGLGVGYATITPTVYWNWALGTQQACQLARTSPWRTSDACRRTWLSNGRLRKQRTSRSSPRRPR